MSLSTTIPSMQNTTSVAKTCEDFVPVYKYVKATQYISILIIVVEVYVLASFLFYGILQLASYFGSRKCKELIRTVNTPKIQVVILHWCATCCQAAALVRVGLTFNASVISADVPTCNAEAISTRIVFALVLCFMYLFLWFRLYLFYQHKFLKSIFNKWLKFMSWFAFCFLWAGTAVFIYIYAVVKSVFIVCDGACQQVESEITTVYIIGCSLSLTFQGIYYIGAPMYYNETVLLWLYLVWWKQISLSISHTILWTILNLVCVQALFVHPLVAKRHDVGLQRPTNNSERINSQTSIRVNNSIHGPKPNLEKRGSTSALLRTWKSNQRIMVYVLKCCFLALICILTDALSLVIGVVVAKYAPFMFPHLILDIDLMINNFCLLFCFKKWRVIVCPWYYAFYHSGWAVDSMKSSTRSNTSSD